MRTCLLCSHFRFHEGCRGYSELTPGYEASLECAKRVWDITLCDETDASFREKLLTAGKCEHYETRKDQPQ